MGIVGLITYFLSIFDANFAKNFKLFLKFCSWGWWNKNFHSAINVDRSNRTSILLKNDKIVVFRQQMLFFHHFSDFRMNEKGKCWKINICCLKTTILLKTGNSDDMLLSASIIATRASVDYSVENRVSDVKKTKNLHFGQKVKIDPEAPICCHEFDLSNITN